MAKDQKNSPYDVYDPNIDAGNYVDDRNPYEAPVDQINKGFGTGTGTDQRAPPDWESDPSNGKWVNGVWTRNPIDPKRPGHYVGNQWIYDDIPITDVNGNPINPPAPPPDTTTPTTPTTPTSPTTPADPGATSAAPTTAKDVFDTTIKTLVGGGGSNVAPYNPPDLPSLPSAPSGSFATSTSAPVKPTHVAGTTIALPGESELDKAVREYILKQLGGPTAEEAGTNAANSAAVNAFRNSQLRDLDRRRAGAVEMAGVEGTDRSGGIEGRVQGLQQAAGEATAKYAGDYAHQAMVDRRNEIQQALTMAQSQGQFDKAQQLEVALANANNDLKRQELENQEYQTEITKWGTGLDAELRKESNANQRYATEMQKLLGMSDLELRRYLGQLQNETSRYDIDTTANTNQKRLDLDWWESLSNDDRERLKIIINGPGKV